MPVSEGATVKVMNMPMPTHKTARLVQRSRALRTSVSAVVIVSMGIGTVISTPSTAAAGDGLGLSSQRVAAPAESGEPTEGESKMERGKRLYYEGVTDYKLGKFEQALGKFEEAYALTSAPNILRNIAVTLGRVAEVKDDSTKLRSSRAMWKNYLSEVYKNPGLLNAANNETVEDVEQIVSDLDAKLAEIDAEEVARAEVAARREIAMAEASQSVVYEPVGPDPGTASRKRGTLWLSLGGGVGGVLTATGLGLVAVFGARASAVNTEGTNNAKDQQLLGCNAPLPQNIITCINLVNAADDINQRGLLAQRNMLAIGLPIAVVGVGLLATGIALGLVQRKKGQEKTRMWREGSSVSVAPTIGGLTVVGRF